MLAARFKKFFFPVKTNFVRKIACQKRGYVSENLFKLYVMSNNISQETIALNKFRAYCTGSAPLSM
jgi:hypothetical protein